ncbi:MAG TPA: hypothetical protein VJU77_02880 [Chthoniobacterales bacterium]|nr:hypothetical protein [Chthoniobacterales bacterium]
MKSAIRNILFSFLLASPVLAGLPAINVAVSDASGKTTFQGRTNAAGLFITGRLGPGKYVVQFDANNGTLKGDRYLIVVAAGTKKITADSVPGERFSAGGVAMKVPVTSTLQITGQIVSERPIASNERIIQGVRYFWVKSGTGSNLGRWVEAGETNPRNVVGMDRASVRNIQERAGEGSASTMMRIPEGHGLTGH